MRALLDVNVLVALFDEEHAFNNRAHDWFESRGQDGWASCPLTENGLIRILSHPRYSAKLQYSPAWVIETLEGFVGSSNHEFWADAPSLRDTLHFEHEQILGSSQITDLYLIGLAVKHQGSLATFDRGVSLSAVKRARPENLCVL